MRRFFSATVFFALFGPLLNQPAAADEATSIAVLPLAYIDTSGEPLDQSEAHAQRSEAFVQSLKNGLSESGKYHVVDLACGSEACSTRTDPADIQKAAQAAGVRLVVVLGVHKMSTLVQWGKLQVIDADESKIVADKLLSFRGDTDEAWERAETFVARELLAANFEQADASAARPIKLAVFPFELLDFSGGGAIIPESAEDRKALQESTDAARKLIAKSGRYTLVNEETSDTPKGPLRECGGCEAKLAKGLGADQSFLGIVTRITRTDYAVTYRLRDTKSGEMIDVGQTDLRIGANYSWDRGAAWLVQNRFLNKSN